MSPHLLEETRLPELTLPEVRKDESAPESVPAATVADLSHDEPVVTRRELWSYYSEYHYIFLLLFNSFSLVYHFGNNVRYPNSARYPDHGFPALILDKCVRDSGLGVRNALRLHRA